MWTLIILAVIQGLTEFLPISSSGHLIILGEILDTRRVNVSLELWLHLATITSLILFFRKELISIIKEWWQWIMVSTLITGAVGAGGRSFFEAAYVGTRITCLGFLVTGLALLLTRFNRRQLTNALAWHHAVIVGLIQSVALIPGISRSGLTIAVLLILGLNRDIAFRYSFVVLIPLVILATGAEIVSGFLLREGMAMSLLIFVIATLAGLLSLYIVRKSLILKRFHWFGAYCIGIALLGLIL